MRLFASGEAGKTFFKSEKGNFESGKQRNHTMVWQCLFRWPLRGLIDVLTYWLNCVGSISPWPTARLPWINPTQFSHSHRSFILFTASCEASIVIVDLDELHKTTSWIIHSFNFKLWSKSVGASSLSFNRGRNISRQINYLNDSLHIAPPPIK